MGFSRLAKRVKELEAVAEMAKKLSDAIDGMCVQCLVMGTSKTPTKLVYAVSKEHDELVIKLKGSGMFE